jgi:serine/threonine-protein kinase
LQQAGFHVATQQKADGKVAVGNVIATQPLGGSRIDEGSTVTMQVSTGPTQVQVPRLSGLTQAEAEQKLNSIGLTLSPNPPRKASSTAETDKVIAQEPSAGVRVDIDQPIVITIGSGPEQVRVPTVVGQDISIAQPNLVDSAGFKVDIQEVKSSAPKGQVLSTNPTGGSNAEKGSTITVQVSAGDRITVPDLSGLTPTQAQEQLRALGWTGQLSQTTVITLDGSASGKVVGQSPAAGSTVTITGNVVLQVGASPLPR